MTGSACGGREVVVCDGLQGIARRAAVEWVASLDQAGREGRRMSVALSGGSTPRSLYQHLVSPPVLSHIDWTQIDFFWGDERCVAPSSRHSNFGQARRDLLSKVGVDERQIHRIRGEQDPREAARDYRACLSRHFGAGAGAFPRFDLVLLGMGADGHTASLFPHTACLEEEQQSVCATFVSSLDAHRVTLTLPVINRARKIVFMISGADKAEAVARVLDGALQGPRLPAARVRPDSGLLLFLVDEAAASRWAGAERPAS